MTKAWGEVLQSRTQPNEQGQIARSRDLIRLLDKPSSGTKKWGAASVQIDSWDRAAVARVTRTGKPASARRRVAEKPSPLLLSGLRGTRIGRGLQRSMTACATGSLAFTIRRILLMPMATVNRSAV
jgi:hypothetical protein